MFEESNFKIKWLSRHCPSVAIDAVSRMVSDAVANSFADLAISKRVEEVLVLDTCYMLIKNSRWIEQKLFQEICADYLVVNFAIDRGLCETFVFNLCQALLPLFPQHELQDLNQKDFLRYLYICTSFARNDEEICKVFGFGSGIFQHIKQAINIANDLADDRKNAGVACFVAELDAALVDVILEINEDYQRNPLSLDVHRFSIVMQNLRPEEKVVLHGIGIERILNLLIFLGSQKSSTPTELARILGKSRGEVLAMMNVLQSLDLIFVSDLSQKGEPKRWELTSFGLDIAAPAFARSYDGHFDWSLIGRLNARYQEAVVMQASLDRLASLAKLPTAVVARFPAVTLEMAIEQMIKLNDSTSANILIKKLPTKVTATPRLQRLLNRYALSGAAEA